LLLLPMGTTNKAKLHSTNCPHKPLRPVFLNLKHPSLRNRLLPLVSKGERIVGGVTA
jgi:hypothetical protein